MQTKYIPDPAKFPVFHKFSSQGVLAPKSHDKKHVDTLMAHVARFHEKRSIAFWHSGSRRGLESFLEDKGSWVDVGLYDIPSMPPFDVIWTELSNHVTSYAVWWVGTTNEDGTGEWVASVMAIDPYGKTWLYPFYARLWFGKDGTLTQFGLHCAAPDFADNEDVKCEVEEAVLVALVGFMFSHCKNVETIERIPTRQAQRSIRRQGHEVEKHREVVILQSHTVTRTKSSGGEKNDRPKKALHLARGHFATYTEDAPLFGKYVGTFWRPAHVRGSADVGTVYKDYKVKA